MDLTVTGTTNTTESWANESGTLYTFSDGKKAFVPDALSRCATVFIFNADSPISADVDHYIAQYDENGFTNTNEETDLYMEALSSLSPQLLSLWDLRQRDKEIRKARAKV